VRASAGVWSDLGARVRPRLFFAAALPALGLYLSTLAPTVTSEDSGELITAASTLGIAHPPGYPLWCVLGKLFTFLPLGTVAWRVNLLSAALGAATVGILALICLRFTKSFFVSLVAALAFAGSRSFWSQCVVAEVYTLNVFFFLLVLHLVLCFEDDRKQSLLYFTAFVLGLSLTNHSTMGPLAPVFLGWVFLRNPRLLLRPFLYLNLPAAFLLGLALMVYLPLRSAPDPVLDWGDPETLSATLDHFFRKQYAGAADAQPRTVLSQAVLVLHFLETFAREFTPAIAALALLGALEGARRERGIFWLLAVLFGLTSYGFIWLLSYRADRECLYLTRVYFLPAHAVAAVWLAGTLKTLVERVRSRYCMSQAGMRPFFALGGAVLVFTPVLAHWKDNDQSRNHLAEDWGRNILASLKPNAIILPSSDHSTFPLLYLQVVEGERPDVLLGDKYGYIEDRVLLDLFQGKDPPQAAPPLKGTIQEKQKYLIEHSARPVYLTTKSRLPGLESHELVTLGLVYEAVKTGTKPEDEEHRRLWESFRWHPGSLERLPGDFAEDLILSDYHYALGRRALLFGRSEEGVRELRVAERYGFGIKEIHNNLGGTLAEAGHPALALPFLKNSLAIDPEYDMALRNLSGALFSLKRYGEALPYFEKALRIDPENFLARLGKARGHKERDEPASAYFAYLEVLEAEPGSDELRAEAEGYLTMAIGKDSALVRALPPKPERRKLPEGAEWGESNPGPAAAEPRGPWTELLQHHDPMDLLGKLEGGRPGVR